MWRYNSDSEEKEIFIYAMNSAEREKVEEFMGDNTFQVSDIKGDVIKLNTTASVIWEMCDGTNTVEEMVDYFCNEYEVNREAAESDVIMILSEFKDLVDTDWVPF